MSLRLGYLTPKQRLIWRLKSERYTKSAFGRKFKIKRQILHKGLNVANQKFFTFAGPVIIGIFVATEVISRKKIKRR